jgi:hypothetical protein
MQPLSQQAVFLCRTPEFLRYVERKRHLLYGCCDERTAADWIRAECGITSRGQLDSDPVCATAFDRLLREYRRSIISADIGQ